jgi:gas vesicle protein
MKAWLSLTLAIALGSAAQAQQSCVYPAAPVPPPDGATATLDQMKAANKDYGRYNTEMNVYLECIKAEIDSTTPKDSSKLTSDQKKAIDDKLKYLDQKNNAAVDELQSTIARFNEQLKIFKAKQKT